MSDAVLVEHVDGVSVITVNRPQARNAGALGLARRIVPNGPLAVAATKAILTGARDWPLEDAFTRQTPLLAPVVTSEDAREGARAFAEMRPPVWKGR